MVLIVVTVAAWVAERRIIQVIVVNALEGVEVPAAAEPVSQSTDEQVIEAEARIPYGTSTRLESARRPGLRQA